MAAITIKNMDVTYNKGKSYVIKDMNLEIKDGECFPGAVRLRQVYRNVLHCRSAPPGSRRNLFRE